MAVAGGGDEVGSLMFNLWDASVPMLPLAARLLLAAFLAATAGTGAGSVVVLRRPVFEDR